MAEQPPLSRIHVVGYSSNDRDFPIVSLVADPRVAGYQVPKDLSACPDKRYPNHVFTGAQPLSGDERVRHTWEILPTPYVPFTRYDDDLGPVQGRRRFVANSGQEATLERDRRVTFEAREGSAIVSTEIEESWDAGSTDPDIESPFPIKDRDFYEPSRGAVQERRQLVSTTGNEVATLENKDGVITQTSYEAYNEFLSFKVVQTYSVDGPQLVGRATDNDGQLVTVTTQRKGSDNYTPPSPTATRTVEVNREDAESLVERIVDTPEVFKANTFSVERPDPIPQKFRVAVPIQSSQEIVEGDAEVPILEEGEISKSEEQRNKFIKRVSSTSRDQAVLRQTLTGKSTNNERQEVTVTETLQLGNTAEAPTATTTIESEALGDGNYVITKTSVPNVFSALTLSRERPDPVPQKFRVTVPVSTREENLQGTAQEPTLTVGQISKSEQQVNEFVKRISTTARDTAQLPRSVTQKLTTNEGLLATVTETLQTGDTTAVPTSKRTVESEALGDGTYVVRVTESPKVFSAKTFRAEKADLTPQKFRSKQSDLTTEENIEGTAEQPTLGEDQFLKSEQQINEFVKRVTTNSRNVELNESLNEFVITPEGQLATRTITLSKSAQTLVPSATVVDGDIEELGDGRTVKTEVKVDEVFDGKQESLEKPEVIPPEFRASLQNRTISEVKTGTSISLPSLSQDELSKTIQRLTEHKIRETKVTRPSSSYPSLTGQLVDNDLIKVTRTRTVAKGSQAIVPSATVSGTVEALGDGFTLKTEDTKGLVFDAKQETLSQSVQVPAKFLNEKVTETSFIEGGTVAQPEDVGNDGFGITQSSAQRVNAFTVRKTKTEQSGVTSLTEKQLNNEGQEVTVESSISSSAEVETGATVEFSRAQAIGGGKFVKEVGRVDEVFDGKQKTIRQDVQVPAKFLEGAQDQESFIEEGTDSEPDDLGEGGAGIIESTAQRITEHKVRKSTVKQEIVTSITENQTNNAKQKITVTSSIVDDPEVESSATTEFVRTQAIGGGKYVKEEGTVDVVFNNKTVSVSKPDVLPERFRASVPTETVQEIIEQASVETPSLEDDDLEISEERVSEFTVRKSTTSRNTGTIPSLDGRDYEESFDVQIPYTERISTEIPDGSAEAVALDDNRYLVREYDKGIIETYLYDFLQTHPTTINMDLPRVLESVDVEWDEKEIEGSYVNTPNTGGVFYTFSGDDKGEASTVTSATPLVSLNFRDVWSKNIPATVFIFFLQNPVEESEILSKTGSQKWPTFKPKSHTITGKGVELRASVSVRSAISVQQPKPGEFSGYSDSSKQKDFSRAITPVIVNIPPCLHGNIIISEEKSLTASISATAATASVGSIGSLITTETATTTDTAFIRGNLGTTSPVDIPKSGKYLIDSNVEFFKYGFSIVRATVIDASVFA